MQDSSSIGQYLVKNIIQDINRCVSDSFYSKY